MHWVWKSKNTHGNIVLNFVQNPIDELAAYAQGYREAAQHLADRLADSSGYRDFEGYPILFLYRHALELYLKAVVYSGARILHLLDIRELDTAKILSSHSLSHLLPGVNAIFKGIGWTWETGCAGIQSFEDFADIVQGIEEMDPNSFCFRYPIDTRGNAATEHHTIVNVTALSQNINPVLDLLDGAVLGLHEEFDATAEMLFEIQEAIGPLNDSN